MKRDLKERHEMLVHSLRMMIDGLKMFVQDSEELRLEAIENGNLEGASYFEGRRDALQEVIEELEELLGDVYEWERD